ncbi:MAG: hypothetical protein N838_20830 [Thiohalocapsa sp. PB-PSB1]|nr:MAG: hypothetical protein N838_20830 [Thiohalocapsa sp. PB-PSB1]
MSMHRTPRALAAILALTLTPLVSAHADPVTDQIDAGRRSYEAGDSRVAIQALQFAIAEIESQLRQQQLKLLPEPLPGWSADDPVSETGGFAAMIAGTNLARTYRNDSSGAVVQIGVTADSPLLAMMGMLMSAPMLMQTDPRNSPYTYGGFRGMMETNEDGNIKITLLVGTRILLQMEGRDGADRQMLEAYLKAIDLTDLEQALLG